MYMATRENREATARVSEEKNKHLATRASELALNHGRPADAVTDADLIWAKRELKPLEISSPKVKGGSGI
ncbi:MAG: hypothetical protein JWM16_16 [Verrucomicrobiales bacterium]|nr:hypothetical protein [Verrucomicrobiales bacterium]